MPLSTATAAGLMQQLQTVVRHARSAANKIARADAGAVPQAAGGVLALLDECGDSRLADVAEALGVGQPVVSRQVAVLERNGWVVRTPDPADGRAARLSVTPSGRDTLQRLRTERTQWLQRALANWDEDEAKTAVALLSRLLADMQAAGGWSLASRSLETAR